MTPEALSGRICWRHCKLHEPGILKMFVRLTDGSTKEIRFDESLKEEVVMHFLCLSIERCSYGDRVSYDVHETDMSILIEADSGKTLSWSYSGVMVEIKQW